MKRPQVGPRRSQSIDAYLRRTRVMAIVAVAALIGGIVSDASGGGFWVRHALLAGLAASVIVVMLSIAVINEVLDRRRRQRWSILAQYVMLELVRNARLIWTSVLEEAGLLASDAVRPELVEANSLLVQDTSRLAAALSALVADDSRRHGLHEEVAALAEHADQVLGRWAAVMLNAEVYAEVIDRHVELASDISWLNSLLDNAVPPEDELRQRRSHSSPAVQIEGGLSSEQLVDRVVVITQLAEELDRTTLELALRIVPVEWWRNRLGTTATAEQSATLPPSF